MTFRGVRPKPGLLNMPTPIKHVRRPLEIQPKKMIIILKNENLI